MAEKKFPEIFTERLVLRKPCNRDIEPMYHISADEEVMEFYGMDPYKSMNQAREEVEWFLKIFNESEGIRWVITEKTNDECIGDVGYDKIVRKHKRAELGYKLAREHWQKGYMTEALSAVISHIYNTTDLNRLEAVVDPRNIGSIRLLEKIGFTQEGLLRDYELESSGFVDLIMLSILRKEVP
jgi:ribosomal-protein-alanine N-acetyltransferase